MKLSCLIALLSFLSFSVFSQTQPTCIPNNKTGKLYFYWGWNWDWYSKSNIHFAGADYDFMLNKVVAKDRQSEFDADTYLNPSNATIPQYNFRVGYFIKNNYNLSIGIDHMKYVMVQNQVVNMSGNTESSGTSYGGAYANDDMVLSDDFLQFEHTDGLNYINVDGRRYDELWSYSKVRINLTEGVGLGMLYPKTNVKLMNFDRNDEFHLAGFGLNGVVAVNVSFFEWFFVQSEFKAGYINMPDIRTTSSTADRADQSMFFYQLNVLLGATIQTRKKTVNPIDN